MRHVSTVDCRAVQGRKEKFGRPRVAILMCLARDRNCCSAVRAREDNTGNLCSKVCLR